MIHVGFTGTRHGMTAEQRAAVQALLVKLAALDELCGHHGDCVGADAEFHDIVRPLARTVVIHPPIDDAHRAFCKSADEWRPAITHLARNRCIVIESAVMIATPYEADRQLRGGTWYTIDYTQKQDHPLAVVAPVGDVAFSGRPWPAP